MSSSPACGVQLNVPLPPPLSVKPAPTGSAGVLPTMLSTSGAGPSASVAVTAKFRLLPTDTDRLPIGFSTGAALPPAILNAAACMAMLPPEPAFCVCVTVSVCPALSARYTSVIT